MRTHAEIQTGLGFYNAAVNTADLGIDIYHTFFQNNHGSGDVNTNGVPISPPNGAY
jgi:hypothetical protein